MGSGPAEGTTADYAITPKDILSFAWQICKGMAYLTDMKVKPRNVQLFFSGSVAATLIIVMHSSQPVCYVYGSSLLYLEAVDNGITSTVLRMMYNTI